MQLNITGGILINNRKTAHWFDVVADGKMAAFLAGAFGPSSTRFLFSVNVTSYNKKQVNGYVGTDPGATWNPISDEDRER